VSSPDQYAYAPNPTIGIDPLGLVGCDPRNLPGVGSGSGGLPDETGRWLRGSHGNAGRIPDQIARQLEGQTFNNFGEFREAFWRAAVGDSNLAGQFAAHNVSRMMNGNSPFVHASQQHGGLVNYVLYHVMPIQHGGGVYDMSNLVVVTPKFHLDTLARDVHF
jgi:hypothetical protein